MALTSDQKAMLRLLAQREEGYEDIAALKGVGVEEVRAQVKAAVAALDDEVSAAGPVAAEGASGLTRPDAPSSTPPAEEEVAPAPRPQAKVKASRSAPRWKEKLLRDKQRVIELGGGALVALLLILFVTGAVDIGGGGDDSASDETVASQINEGKRPTQAVLREVNGSGAAGQALLGRLKDQVALAIAAKGLEPSGQGRSYAVSLVRSPNERVPITATKVGKSGEIGGSYVVAPNVPALIASGFDRMEISRVINRELRTAVTKAQRQEAAPSFGGTTVLRGKVTGPIVDAGQKAGNEAGGGNGNGG